MRKATAWSVRGVEPATQEIAEEAARRAGMSLGDWLDQVVAEQAAEQGVATEDLNEDDKLDAIGARLARLSRRVDRAEPRRPRDAPKPQIPAATLEETRIARERLDAAITKFESRAAKTEERTAKAFESVASWIERDQIERLEERETLQTVAEKLASIERRAQRDSELLRAAVADKSAREEEKASRIDARLDALARRIATPREAAAKSEPAAPRESFADELARRAPARPRNELRLDAEPARIPRARPDPEPEADWDEPTDDRAPPRAKRVAREPEPEIEAETRRAEPPRRVAAAAVRASAPRWEEPFDEPAPRATRIARDPEPEVEFEVRRAEAPRRAAAVERRPAPEPPASPAPEPARGARRAPGPEWDEPVAAPEAPPVRAPVPPRADRPRLDVRQAVEQIARRRAENEQPAPSRPSEKIGAPPPRNGWRNFGVDAGSAAAAAGPSVDDLRKEMTDLDERLAKLRAGRDERRSTVALDAVEPMASPASTSRGVADLAPRGANVALEGGVDDLGRRVAVARDAGASERLVAPVEAMVRQVLDALRERDPRVAAAALEREIRALGGKIDALAGAAVDPEMLRRMRAQSDEIRAAITAAAANPVPVERLERQIGQLAERVERIASSPAPHAEIAQILQLLAETHAQIERSTPARALNAIEQRLEQLTTRVDDAARRPSPAIDARPIEDLARRVDAMRDSLERRPGEQPDLAPLEASLREINAKLDRAPAGAGDSKAVMTTLLGLGARLEETFKQAKLAQADTKPFEEFARRIDGVRATVERQSDFGKHAARFEAAIDDLGAKIDRAPAPAPESPALAKTLRDLEARLVDAFQRSPDQRPLEDLGRRVDEIRAVIERQAGPGPVPPELKAALREIGAKLDRQAALPVPLDTRPLEDLARRVDAVRSTVERQAGPGADAAELKGALREIGGKLDKLTASPAPIDPRPFEALGRRIDDMRAVLERQGGGGVSELKIALRELGGKLDRVASSSAPPDSRLLEDMNRRLDDMRDAMARMVGPGSIAPELSAALREIDAKLDRQAAAPVALDNAPLDELARRIDSVRSAVERQAGPGPEAAAVKAGFREIGAKLDRLAAAPIPLDSRPLEDFARRIESARAAVERQAGPGPDAAELKAALRELGAKLDRQAASLAPYDPKPLEDFARLLEDTRASLERRAGQVPDAAELKAALREIDAKLDRQAEAPMTLDRTPLDDLARRIDDVRATVERQAVKAPDASELKAALREIGAKLDSRAAAPVAIDPRPLDDLGRRIDAMRATMELKASSAPDASDLQAALREISAKFDSHVVAPVSIDARPLDDLARRIDDVRATVDWHAGNAPDASELRAALREIGAKFDTHVARPIPIDARPLDELARQIDDVRATVERQMSKAPDASELKAALREIGAKFDSHVAAPVSIDARPLDELARQFDDVRATVERQMSKAPDASELKAALREIGAKFDSHVAAPVSIDSRPLDELGRRIDAVRASVERQASSGSSHEDVANALREISAKLDRHSWPALGQDARALQDLAGGVDELRTILSRQLDRRPDSEAIEGALREISAKLDRQVSAPVRLDPRPIEDLARRIDDVRATVERGPDTSELRAALRDIDAKLDRPSTSPAPQDTRPIEDLARRIDDVRASLERQTQRLPDPSDMTAALRDIHDRLDRQAASPPALDPRPLEDLGRRIDEMRATIARQMMERSDASALEPTLREINAKLDRQAATPARLDSRPLEDLARRIDDVRASLERQTDLGLDSFRWDAALREISAKLDRHAVSTEDSRALTDVIQELAARVDKGLVAGVDMAALEGVLRDLGEKRVEVDTSSIEAALRELTERVSAASPTIETASIERLLNGFDAKLDELGRSNVDARALEQAVHELRVELANRPESQIDARLVEQAAEMLAQRFEKRNVTALDTEALISQISEIHGRLDTFDIASSSNAALERTVSELIEELETTRRALQSTQGQAGALAPLANGIAELRAEQANSDRRMESRLFGVQGILEKLADRIARFEDEDEREPPRPASRPAAAAKPPSGGNEFNLRDIPDRDAGIARRTIPAAARPLETPSVVIGPDASPARNAAINAHIAAARRAAQTAMAEHAEKAEATVAPVAPAPKPSAGLGSSVARAGAMFAKHRRPILLGATAAALTVAATVAVVELRGGGHPKEVQKSELDAPIDGATPQAPSTPDAPAKTAAALDYNPTGSVEAKPAAPAQKPAAAAAPAVAAKSVPGDLVASLPTALPQPLRDAAASGDSGAETEIAFRYLDGRAVTRDFKQASRWFELAAAQDLPIAQYRLAALYEKGNGVPRDAAQARAWYLKAATAGNARAMHNLAVLCAQDAGAGKPDYAQAAQWFRRAADLGVRDSQYNLGVLYGRGLGVSQDLSSSWKWFSLASRQGDADAAKKRDEVAAKMDAAQIAGATKALADFKAAPLDRAANEAPAPPGGWDPKPTTPQATGPAATRS